jgi:outer membrane immunogenic protein
MKKLCLLITVLTVFGCSYGQSPLPVGKAQLNAGVGLSGWGVPFYLGMDYSVTKNITIGGELSYRSFHEEWKGYSYNHNIIGISGNGNYHFNTVLKIPRKYDLYAGLNIGYYAWTSSTGYDGNNSSGLGLGIQIGGRYYFSKKVGINLELGGGNAFSGGKFGISIKL